MADTKPPQPCPRQEDPCRYECDRRSRDSFERWCAVKVVERPEVFAAVQMPAEVAEAVELERARRG